MPVDIDVKLEDSESKLPLELEIAVNIELKLVEVEFDSELNWPKFSIASSAIIAGYRQNLTTLIFGSITLSRVGPSCGRYCPDSGMSRSARVQEQRAPNERNDTSSLPAQHLEIRLTDIGDLRNHPDVVVTLIDEQVIPETGLVEQNRFHCMDVFKAAAIGNKPRAALLQVLGRARIDLSTRAR